MTCGDNELYSKSNVQRKIQNRSRANTDKTEKSLDSSVINNGPTMRVTNVSQN